MLAVMWLVSRVGRSLATGDSIIKALDCSTRCLQRKKTGIHGFYLQNRADRIRCLTVTERSELLLHLPFSVTVTHSLDTALSRECYSAETVSLGELIVYFCLGYI